MKRFNEPKLEKLFDMCPVGIAQCHLKIREGGTLHDLLFDELNLTFAEILGLAHESIKGKTTEELLPLMEETSLLQEMIKQKLEPDVQEQTFEHHAAAQNRWYKVMVKPISPETATFFISDITPEKQTEEILRRSEERFRTLVEMAPDIIFVQTGGTFAYVNKAMVRMMEAGSEEDLLGKPVLSIVHPDYHEAISGRIRVINELKQPAASKELVLITLNGTELEVESKAVPIRYQSQDGALVYIRNITERRDAERMKQKQLDKERHRQKMEAIGMLASGVAHEINNPIMGVINYAQLLLDGNLQESEKNEYASNIMDESKRVALIVHNLLMFASRGQQTYSLVRVEDILSNTLSIMKTALIKDEIMIQLDAAEGLPPVRCCSEQIQQILTNLLNNSRDALNEKYPDSHDNKCIRLQSGLYHEAGRPWVRLTVEDNGNGIPEMYQEHLFDPFFSTKGRLKGAGLGLPISYGIAEDHHGVLHFETKPGQYTRFHLDLPVDYTANNGNSQ